MKLNFFFQPKFLTKEERAAEAVKRRQEEVDAKRKALDEERKKNQEFLKAARESTGNNCPLVGLEVHLIL